MSMTFFIEGNPDGPSINLSNVNACDVLRHLGLAPEPSGSVTARDLAARCGRALMHVVGGRKYDPEIPERIDAAPGRATMIECGRRPGYLRERTEQLLAIAREAVNGTVVWS